MKEDRKLQPELRTLVIGTTPDYIDWVRRSDPGQTLFITDPKNRSNAEEPQPEWCEEILCDLEDYGGVWTALDRHMKQFNIRPNGIMAFDCESMEAAAWLGRSLCLRYPSPQAIRNCRNKHLAKCIWEKHGLITPKSRIVYSAREALSLHKEIHDPCVMKPVDGSGSQLVFLCRTGPECEAAYKRISLGLSGNMTNDEDQSTSGNKPVLIESIARGAEYSCDFAVANGRAKVVRMTKKIMLPQKPFGTAVGYALTPPPPPGVTEKNFLSTLYISASALGIDRAVCMLDFMVHKGKMILLELAPRPGGDCIPHLMDACLQYDMLKASIKFSRGGRMPLPRPLNGPVFTGVRIHALKSGTLKDVDVGKLRKDPRVKKTHVSAKKGCVIKMPPDDYDSWVLGWIIFKARPEFSVESQCEDLLKRVRVEMY